MAVLTTLSRCCPLLQVLQMQLSMVTPANVPTAFRSFEHLTHVGICVGPPFSDDESSMATTHKFLWEIFPVQIHYAKGWGAYSTWRVEKYTEDSAVTGLHNADVWHGWLRDVDLLVCGLRDLWWSDAGQLESQNVA